MKPLRKLSLFFLTLCLMAAALIPGAAAAGGLRLVGSGLITGTSGTTLSPAGSATRAQAAVILARFCQTLAQ